LVENREGLIASSLLQQRGTQIGQIVRLRMLPYGARYPLDRVIKLSGLQAEESHKVQRVGVLCVERKRLLATDLRLELPTGEQMPQAGFIESCRHSRGWFVPVILGGFGSRPPLATIHRNSNVGNRSTRN